MHQAEVALFDQVRQRYAPAQVELGDADDQPQVVFDHALSRGKVAGPRAHGGLVFLLGGEELGATHIAQVGCQRVTGFTSELRFGDHLADLARRDGLDRVGHLTRVRRGRRLSCS